MIRVLALNDDNHETFFVREDGTRYHDAQDFIKNCLAMPHSTEYNIRGIYLCDEFEGIDDEELEAMFMCVEHGSYHEYSFVDSFDKLWIVSSERWH